jgi:hypothetical protein
MPKKQSTAAKKAREAAASGAKYTTALKAGTVGRVFGVFRSTDEGATWRRLNDDRHQFGYLFGPA